MSVPNHQFIVDQVQAAGRYNLRTHEGCGQLVEAATAALHAHDPRWGFLKKTGGTMYNGHSHDGSLYLSDVPGQSTHVDYIAAAESQNPADNPHVTWNPDTPRYSASDWYAPSGGGVVVTPGPSSWLQKHSTLLNLIYSKFPNPSTQLIAEQFAFSFPGEAWQQKRAGVGRQISPDAIARQLPGGDKEAYLVIPKPSGTPRTFGPGEMNIQILVRVEPKDHVGGGTVVVPVPGPVDPPPAPVAKPYVGPDKAEKLGELIRHDWRRSGQELNPGSFIWAVQVCHDYYAGMTWEAAVEKQRGDWCGALGIKADPGPV